MPNIPGESASRPLASHHQSDKDLEDVVCKAIMKADVEVSGKNIKDLHRAGKMGQTIVKFCKRKISKQVLNVKKDLTKLSMENWSKEVVF